MTSGQSKPRKKPATSEPTPTSGTSPLSQAAKPAKVRAKLAEPIVARSAIAKAGVPKVGLPRVAVPKVEVPKLNVAEGRMPPAPVDAATVVEIFARLRAANPEPRAELDYRNPFTLLVAVVLSAQATDRSVNHATAPLFAIADTPQAMLDLGEERVRGFIRTIGLFNTKAKNVVALSRILVERHGGEVPAVREHLEVLPGVGTKTASVVMNVAFGEATIAVDTHIFRVSNRIPLVVAPTTDKVQAGLEAIVPEPFRLNAHHWLILFGRYICKARKPECPLCPINDLCRYPDKTLAA